MRTRTPLIVVATLGLAFSVPVLPASAVPSHAVAAAPALTDVQGFGDASSFGSTHLVAGNQPIVGIAGTATSSGYWEAAVDGGVFTFGDAHFFGSMGGAHLNQPVVGIAATRTGNGYWLVASDGGVFTFGDAHFFGSMGGTHLNQPVVGIAATPTGNGYWLVASDGGVFTFGDAHFFGSMGGTPLNQPMAGIAGTHTGNGYWLVAGDGGVFTFGDARFFGSTGGTTVRPVVGIAARPSGDGYWLADTGGGVHAFGHAPLPGGTAAAMTKPIVGIAPTRSGKGYWLAGRGTAAVYFLRGEKLGAATRDAHGGDVVANVARDLVAGPNATERAAGLATAIPAGTRVNAVTVAGNVATVDLSAQFTSGGGSLSMQERVAQVVFTLTGLPGIDRVSFAIDGRHVTTIGGEGLLVDPPVGRSGFEAFLPQVLIVTPGPGDVVTSPLVVTGEINSFEGVGILALSAADGRILAQGTGMGAMGSWVPFTTALAFQPAGAATGTLIARPSAGVETPQAPDAVIPVRFR